jgi:hypothetical protein
MSRLFDAARSPQHSPRHQLLHLLGAADFDCALTNGEMDKAMNMVKTKRRRRQFCRQDPWDDGSGIVGFLEM